MKVEHDHKGQRFYIPTDGEEPYLSYELDEETGALDLQHTIVPEDREGSGLGTALVEFALDYAKANELKVIPSCAFVDAYVKRHKQYQKLLLEE